MKYAELQNYVGGDFVATQGPRLDVYNPSNGDVISRVPLSATAEVDAAVQAARAAFPAWSAKPIKERVQVFYKYKTLLEQNIDELAALITEENGKITSEARAEVLKSAELSEFACSLPQITPGEVLEVSRGVECRVERFPLGVVASIAPFNFPNMVPNWTIPNAIALGNCMILKPSELVPISAGRIAELLRDAGLPAGVFQVVHGGREAVEAICDHPDIAAVSFVGSTNVAKIVYRRATANLKRCLALGGAKNHLIVMPDADREMAATNIVASMSGCAGQRCMAASVMVAVSKTDHIIERMIDVARAMVPGKDVGPVISAAAKERITRYIDEAEAARSEGAGRRTKSERCWPRERILPRSDDHRSRHAGYADRARGSLWSGARDRAHAGRRRCVGDRKRVAVWERGIGVHRERRRRALRDGARERRNGRRQRGRSGAARAVLVRRVE